MANVSKIKLGDNVYDIRDAAVPSHVKSITQNDINSWDGKQDALTAGNGIAIDNQDTIRSIGIPYGVCDSTSTATAFTVTVPGIDRLEDGVCCIVKNNKVTSAEGFTLNVNGLGAKPSYSNMATGNPVTPTSPTRDTTIFNINYAMLFIYSSTLVEGGAWICYRGYDANTNTIGYQLRHNSSTLPVPHKFYRYRLLFTSADGTQYIPANASTSTNATAKRDTTQYPINPFGEILYYSSSTAINANATPAATVLWEEYVLNLGYSFNRTGAALVLTYPAPVYLKCAPLTNGSAIIEAETPYVQALPSTNDGKIYILLGIAYSATNIELLPTHPVYYHDGTGIRTWTGKTIPSIAGLATETYVDNAIAALPAPMVFLGTIGTSGTSTTVPSDPTEGDTYKIIEGGTSLTFSGITGTIKVGDTVVYKNSTVGWVLIPSGDEPSGTVTSVDMSVPTGLQVSGNPITTSGTLALSYANGYAIPTTAKQANWDTAYNQIGNKANSADLAGVAFSGSYNDLSGTPNLATVATSGSYNDLTNKPTIPTSSDIDAAKPLIVTLTTSNGGDTFNCDTSNADIYAASQSGRDVIVYCGSYHYYPSEISNDYAIFTGVDWDQAMLRHIFEINTTGNIQTVSYSMANYEPVLTLDNTPTQNSNNPVKSGGVYSALANKADKTVIGTLTGIYDEDNEFIIGYTCDKTFSELYTAFNNGTQVILSETEDINTYFFLTYCSSSDLYFRTIPSFQFSFWLTIDDQNTISYGVNRYQSALTFDNTPTQNSNNPVKSGGVYTALQGKEDAKIVNITINRNSSTDALTIYDENNNQLTDAQFRTIANNYSKKITLRYLIDNQEEMVVSRDLLYQEEDYWFFNDKDIYNEYNLTLAWDNSNNTIYIDEALTTNIYDNVLYGYVKTNRKINNKPLSADITLTANDVGADVFVVNIDIDNDTGNWVSNKTNAQIYAAWQAGRSVICLLDGEGLYYLVYIAPAFAKFKGLDWDTPNGGTIIKIGLDQTNSQYIEVTYNDLQLALESGTNIKTINSQSILGSGNLTLTASDVGAMEKVILHFEYNEQNDEVSFTDFDGLELTHAEVRSICNSGAYISLFDEGTGLMLIPRELSYNSWAFTYGGGSYNLLVYFIWDSLNSCITCSNYEEYYGVPSSRTINGQELSSDITLTANDVGAATSSDISTAISNLVDSAPTTLDTLNELAAALGDDPNFATTVTNQIAAKTIYAGSVAGKLYRNNVGGTGNFTVSGNSGCIPNIPAGTYVVAIYAKSSTQSYTYRFNFGSVTYDLATTNGIINDVRTITLSSAGTFSGVVQVGSVASGSILSVTMYNFHMPINSVGMAAVTNSYNDLNDRPTIPTVNNGTLTIQKNGTNVLTFTANQSSSVTANITVPTTASDVGAVPTTRKVNNKELSSDITLTASDVGALPSNTTIPTVDSSLTGSSQTNPVQGGAIYDVLQDKEDAYITVIELIWDENVSSPISFKDSNNNTLTHSQVKALFDNPAKNIALWLDSLYTIFKLTEYHGNYNSSSDYYLFYTPPQSGRWELGLDYDGSSFHVDAFGQLLPSPNEIGAVPTSRKINNKALSSDITLTASDVGALPSNTVIPSVVNNLTTTTTGSALDASLGKALKDLIDGITVPSASTTTPVMDGTAAIGSSSEYAKADHVHPSDTSKANVITKTTVSTSGAVSLAMTSGVFYSFTGTPSSLTLTLTAPSTGLGIYAGKFTASSTGCTLSVPASVTESIDNPNIVANGTYEFNIMDNVLLMVQI